MQKDRKEKALQRGHAVIDDILNLTPGDKAPHGKGRPDRDLGHARAEDRAVVRPLDDGEREAVEAELARPLLEEEGSVGRHRADRTAFAPRVCASADVTRATSYSPSL